MTSTNEPFLYRMSESWPFIFNIQLRDQLNVATNGHQLRHAYATVRWMVAQAVSTGVLTAARHSMTS